MTIHRRRGGGYWHYWAFLIGGTLFVIVALLTDGFGTGAV